MKKSFTILALTSLVATGMQAQSAAELEAKQAEVKSQLENYDDGISKKFEIRLDASYVSDFSGFGFTSDRGNGILKTEEGGLVNLGVGYNFNSHWYAGLASGYVHNMVTTANQGIPLLADVAYRYNFRGEHWSVFGEARGGYIFSVTAKQLLSGGNVANYPNAFMGEIEAGAYWRITRYLDLKLALGYLHYNPSEKGGFWQTKNGNYGMIKVGFNFRVPPTKTPNFKKIQAQYDELSLKIAAARAAEEAEQARLAAEEAARKAAAEEAARKAAAEEAARKAAAEEAARKAAADQKAAEEAAIREAARKAQKSNETNLVIFYEIRESDITSEHYEELDKVGEWLKNNHNYKIIVKSYADKGTGNHNLNDQYSKLRVEKVKAELIKKYGVKANKIETHHYGDSEQVFGENNKNRCTLITLKKVK